MDRPYRPLGTPLGAASALADVNPVGFDYLNSPTTGASPFGSDFQAFNPRQIAGYGAMPQQSNWFGIDGLGKNMDTLQLGLGGLQTLAGLWGAIQASKIAKDNLKFTRASANANLANQTQSYNTAIADRARSRGAWEGQSQGQVADYIAKNQLAQRTV